MGNVCMQRTSLCQALGSTWAGDEALSPVEAPQRFPGTAADPAGKLSRAPQLGLPSLAQQKHEETQAGACLHPAVSILWACSLPTGTKGNEEEKGTPATPPLGRQGWIITVRIWRRGQSTEGTGARGMEDQPRPPCARSGASSVAELRNEPNEKDLSSLLVWTLLLGSRRLPANRRKMARTLPSTHSFSLIPDSTSPTQNFPSKPHKMVLPLRLLGSSCLK